MHGHPTVQVDSVNSDRCPDGVYGRIIAWLNAAGKARSRHPARWEPSPPIPGSPLDVPMPHCCADQPHGAPRSRISRAPRRNAPLLRAALLRNPADWHPPARRASDNRSRLWRQASLCATLQRTRPAPRSRHQQAAPGSARRDWPKWPVVRREARAAKGSDQLASTWAARSVRRRTNLRPSVARRRSGRATIQDTAPPQRPRCHPVRSQHVDRDSIARSLVEEPSCRAGKACWTSPSRGYCGRQRRCMAMIAWQRSLPEALELAGRERRPVLAYIWKEG